MPHIDNGKTQNLISKLIFDNDKLKNWNVNNGIDICENDRPEINSRLTLILDKFWMVRKLVRQSVRQKQICSQISFNSKNRNYR